MPDTDVLPVLTLALSVVALVTSVWLAAKRATIDKELQAQRARLDQLDRLHSRRVEQIEKLYAQIEATFPTLFSALPDGNETAVGAEEFRSLRSQHAITRIYLSDEADRLCEDFLEEAQRAWECQGTAEEYAQARQLPDEVRQTLDGFDEVVRSARALRDRLRTALRVLLKAPD